MAIAVEARECGPGRVRMQRIANASKDVLTDFVLNHVERGAEVRTHGWTAYDGVGEHRFTHVLAIISGSGDPGRAVPAVVNFADVPTRPTAAP